MPGVRELQLLADELHHFAAIFPDLPDGGQHSSAIGGLLAQSRNIEVAVESLREGARYRASRSSISTSGASPRATIRERCKTPNLCCSSMTTSPEVLQNALDS